jgi:tRNA A37 threonylcarbamoyladenosine biosynthesis protein TsaE
VVDWRHDTQKKRQDPMNDMTPDKRIPIYLLTGYLGSGKTSLLKSWLAQEEMKEAAWSSMNWAKWAWTISF